MIPIINPQSLDWWWKSSLWHTFDNGFKILAGSAYETQAIISFSIYPKVPKADITRQNSIQIAGIIL